MKKSDYCLFLFLTTSFCFLGAQVYDAPIPVDKSKVIDVNGKSPSTSAIRITQRVRENYQSTFSR